MISTFLFLSIEKSRLNLNSPSTLSENIVSLLRIFPISYPIITPPMAGDKIKSKSLNDFDLEVYAMAQVEGEDEPVRLTFPDEVIKNKRG